MSFVLVASLDSLWPGEMVGCAIGSTKVVLANVDGRVFAYEDRCAHKGVELSRGRLTGCELVCHAHRWAYDVCAGVGTNPEGARLRAFPVRMDGRDILVDVNAKVDDVR